MIAYSLEDPLYQPVVVKNKQRFWKRIFIIDGDDDTVETFKAGIEDSNTDTNKRIEVYTSNNPYLNFHSSMLDMSSTMICTYILLQISVYSCFYRVQIW
ncbi:MAG: hypothetical protein WB988_16175 [Candidatus Nitrosopolaris sp.]